MTIPCKCGEFMDVVCLIISPTLSLLKLPHSMFVGQAMIKDASHSTLKV